ncbi:glutamate-5-semialdehyde dehydrogenase [Alteromonas stellipolaris]|jgi:glutamate-5-semialdehyde dehydrogenase|uniref:Gamma-glutamyl phosphate reductase n=1 Tax=Alteromonas stellipolaris TaxID=233316 RepID=A0ABN4LL19_9ALTE|nr:glutamate-5-semialdehyde dehydrogenase [Alteromonas stellipolaris]ALM90777.1 Gamma-glutamyl phosphate reductase [Alteromonas stellipolaris LMG 21856]AMJ73831.1 gamma-glutamyl-phosphate reductase [Alteromonas stellipolaris]ANB27024.1 gamma-glutamyl-phosphate reductase [Alteromonas stellipolaris]
MSIITELAKQAKQAAQTLAILDEAEKNAVLKDMAAAIRGNKDAIKAVNEKEVARARENNLDDAMIDRLILDDARIESMAEGIEVIISLDDPVGRERVIGTRPNGIEIKKMRIPLGVVCMIYEARPNVTADAGALCFKSGNGVILRGGKEALDTSLTIAGLMQDVLEKHGLPRALVTVVPNPDRALMQELMEQRDYIDVIIPRGGEGLINYVTEHSKVPVIQHFKGVCHLYVDKDADLDKALAILLNGKTQRTGVCNALEGLVVHQAIAGDFLPRVAEAFEQHKVTVHVNEKGAQYFNNADVISEDAYGEEYLGLEIAIRVVDDFAGAISHIADFGSNHTEVICTENEDSAKKFQRAVDASVVMVNASSRFSDGSQLGLGAEIGIATTKLHAYGPMGLESLTSEKYLVNGVGQIRE